LNAARLLKRGRICGPFAASVDEPALASPSRFSFDSTLTAFVPLA